MPKFISLIVSAYSDSNYEFFKLKKEADAKVFAALELKPYADSKLAKERVRTLISEAQANYKKIRTPGTDFLKEHFKGINDFLPYVGIFAKEIEPSMILQIPFKDEAEWRANERMVKLKLIAFGKRFSQSTVHLADLNAAQSPGIDYGTRVDWDVTKQVKYFEQLKRAERDFGNIWLLQKEAIDQAHLDFLSTSNIGDEVLLYSIGGKNKAYSEKRKQLRKAWDTLKPSIAHLLLTQKDAQEIKATGAIIPDGTRNLAAGTKYDVHLTVYGKDEQAKKEYGATHTYDEALEMIAKKMK